MGISYDVEQWSDCGSFQEESLTEVQPCFRFVDYQRDSEWWFRRELYGPTSPFYVKQRNMDHDHGTATDGNYHYIISTVPEFSVMQFMMTIIFYNTVVTPRIIDHG